MGIYKVIKKRTVELSGYAGIAVMQSFNEGDFFFKEPYKAVQGTNNWYPIKGGYPIWDRDVNMEEYTEKVMDTDKPKEYFLDKKYSQYELDELLKNIHE